MRILFLTFLFTLGLSAQEEVAPAIIEQLQGEIADAETKLEKVQQERESHKKLRAKVEELAKDLSNNLENLKNLTSGATPSKVTGELLQEAFQRTKNIRAGELPYSIEEIRENLADHRGMKFQAEDDLKKDDLDVPDDLKREAGSLLKNHQKILTELVAALKDAIAEEETILEAAGEVTSNAEALRSFVLPRIFWFRSREPLGARTFKNAASEFNEAREMIYFIPGQVAQSPINFAAPLFLASLVTLFLIVPFLFFWTGRKIQAAVPEKGKRGHRRLLAAIMFFRAFLPGLIALLIAFLLRSLALPDHVEELAGQIFNRIGLLLLVILPVRALCHRDGLGVRAFSVPENVARWFKTLITKFGYLYLVLRLVPQAIGSMFTGWTAIPFFSNFLYHFGIVILTWSALRRTKAMAQFVKQAKGRRSFLWKNWSFISGMILLVLLATLVGDLMGYSFAADSIFRSMLATALVGFLLFVLFKPAESAALQLSQAHAIAWDEAVTEEAPPSEEGAEIPEVDQKPKELDQASRERTKSLVRTVFLFLGVLTLIGIWNTDGRLYYAFDQISLFRIGETNFSLASVAGAILTLVIAISVLKSLPAIFELFVFPRFDIDSGLRYAIVSITRYILLAIIAFAILGMLKVDFSSLGWLVAALGVGLGFGLQEIVSNFVSGIIILIERPIRVGDIVTVGGQTGAVSKIQIRATTITNWDRLELIIPNKDFITKEVTNWTLTSSLTRVIVPIGVAYGSDPEQIKKILLDIASQDRRVANDPAPMALFRSHGASSLDFELRVYIPEPGDRVWVEDSLTTEINRVLTEAEIEIPFPQQDLYIREMPLRSKDVKGDSLEK